MWISKNDFNGLKDQFNNLSEKIDEHRETIFELQRIIEHYKMCIRDSYKDAWCQETLLDWLHIATNEEVELYKKVMGIK